MTAYRHVYRLLTEPDVGWCLLDRSPYFTDSVNPVNLARSLARLLIEDTRHADTGYIPSMGSSRKPRFCCVSTRM